MAMELALNPHKVLPPVRAPPAPMLPTLPSRPGGRAEWPCSGTAQLPSHPTPLHPVPPQAMKARGLSDAPYVSSFDEDASDILSYYLGALVGRAREESPPPVPPVCGGVCGRRAMLHPPPFPRGPTLWVQAVARVCVGVA